MNIVVIGAGRIGSTFAFHLALAGHEVGVVARGARLETLRQQDAIVAVDGRRAPVRVASVFDPTVPYDLVIVTMPEHQVDPLLPSLAASAAKTTLLMFNTFQGTRRYREALGPERFAFGFPKMTAFLVGGQLRCQVDGPGMVTTLSGSRWVALFRQAGLPTEVEDDMDSFLRSHVAFVVPLFLAGTLTWKRNTDLTWVEARRLTEAWHEGFGLVRHLGHSTKPRFVAMLSRMPPLVLTALLWAFSRSAGVKNVGEFGPTEVRWLIDSMAAAASGRTPRLLAVRP